MLVHSSAGQRSGHSFPRSLDEDPSQNCSAGVVWKHGCLTVEQGEDALSLKLARVVVGRIDFFMDCGSGSLSVACRVSISVGQFRKWLHYYMQIR